VKRRFRGTYRLHLQGLNPRLQNQLEQVAADCVSVIDTEKEIVKTKVCKLLLDAFQFLCLGIHTRIELAIIIIIIIIIIINC
jgi:hypothetical protein